jgi:hypothetical protein
MPDTPERAAERRLISRQGAHTSWANTTDRTARTAPARRAWLDKIAATVDPDGVMDPATRAKAIESAVRAFYAAMSRKSQQARRRAAFLKANMEADAAEDAMRELAPYVEDTSASTPAGA